MPPMKGTELCLMWTFRGIDVVREKIKGFAQKKINLGQGNSLSYRIICPGLHKIVILDEADSLTEGAQQALRMIISDYADSTRYRLYSEMTG